MVSKMLRLSDMGVAALDWLSEENLPEAVEALNNVIREWKYLYLNAARAITNGGNLD